jgi:uncharacterized protein (UPF0261 family)
MGRRRAAIAARQRQVTLVLGTLDTKGAECRFLFDRIRALGCETITVDQGRFTASHGRLSGAVTNEVGGPSR